MYMQPVEEQDLQMAQMSLLLPSLTAKILASLEDCPRVLPVPHTKRSHRFSMIYLLLKSTKVRLP